MIQTKTKKKTSLDGIFSWKPFRLWFPQNNMQCPPSFFLFTFYNYCQHGILLEEFFHSLYYWHKAFAETGCLVHRSLGGGGVPRPPNSATAPGPSNHVRSLPGNLLILITFSAPPSPNIWPTYILSERHSFSMKCSNSPLLGAHPPKSDVFCQIWLLSWHCNECNQI